MVFVAKIRLKDERKGIFPFASFEKFLSEPIIIGIVWQIPDFVSTKNPIHAQTRVVSSPGCFCSRREHHSSFAIHRHNNNQSNTFHHGLTQCGCAPHQPLTERQTANNTWVLTDGQRETAVKSFLEMWMEREREGELEDESVCASVRERKKPVVVVVVCGLSLSLYIAYTLYIVVFHPYG